MRHADHLIVAFDKQRRNRERRAFKPSEALFDVVLVAIFLYRLCQRQTLLRRIAGIGAPAQRRDECGNRFLLALDGGDLIAHPLDDLLWALGSPATASDQLDLLLNLPLKAIGEQARHAMPAEDGLRRA